MKQILLINGSPRKNGNIASLLEEAAKGAKSAGKHCQTVHLYDIQYTGCLSCFACKKRISPKIGSCALRDDLTPILEQAMDADAIILGSPVYLMNISSAMQAFLERFIFMNSSYDSNENYSTFSGKIDLAFFYTMNLSHEESLGFRLDQKIKTIEFFLHFFHGTVQTLVAYDTYQFDDYSRYRTSAIPIERKEKSRRIDFPKSRYSAYTIGKNI